MPAGLSILIGWSERMVRMIRGKILTIGFIGKVVI
jgi:hypothetical protein